MTTAFDELYFARSMRSEPEPPSTEYASPWRALANEKVSFQTVPTTCSNPVIWSLPLPVACALPRVRSTVMAVSENSKLSVSWPVPPSSTSSPRLV